MAQLQAAQKAAGRHGIVSNQVRYNLIDRTIEQDLLPYCQANGITVIAYTPLARGLSRIRTAIPNRVLDRLARETGKTPAQVALNWCLCKDRVVAIPMSNAEEHLLENCAASGWRLTAEQATLLDTNIRFRHRGRFDVLVRRHMPAGLQSMALRAVKWLPRACAADLCEPQRKETTVFFVGGGVFFFFKKIIFVRSLQQLGKGPQLCHSRDQAVAGQRLEIFVGCARRSSSSGCGSSERIYKTALARDSDDCTETHPDAALRSRTVPAPLRESLSN